MAFALEGPTSIEVKQGESATAVIRILATSRPYRNVSLAITGLPTGVTGSFSPQSGKPTFQSILTLRASSGSATGTFTLTITARDAKSTKGITLMADLFRMINRPSGIEPGDIHVATTGNDTTGDGSIGNPYATLLKAHDVAVAGNLIYVRGGTYDHSAVTTFTRDGAAGNLIRMFAYPGETPILDGTNSTGDGYPAGYVLSFNGANYWHLKGFEIKAGPVGGFFLDASSNNIIELLNLHNNARVSASDGNGMAARGACANNLILNCDSHHNRDQSAQGTNADGFHLAVSGSGNIIRGCRAYFNSDDGFDNWNSAGTWGGAGWTYDSCWAFRNGYDDDLNPLGNGNGYKLGGTPTPSGGHTLQNCLSFGHRNHGFLENGANTAMNLYNCAATHNGGSSYIFATLTGNVFHNCHQHGNGSGETINASADDSFCSWTLAVTVSDADFDSVSFTGADGARQSDGSLPVLSYLKLAVGSDLIDAGTDVGLSYLGAAPDLGPYEKA